jgi:steroid delta-isomerase-like uncharacterized protein
MAIPEPKSITDSNKAIARRLVEEFWNESKADLAETLAAPDFERIELFSDTTNRGPEGLKAAAEGWRGAFPDAHLTLDQLLAEGDQVACQWTFTGTHKGELNGTPPTGKTVKITGLSIIDFAEGKMIKEIVAADMLGLMKQLGVFGD